MTDDQQHTDEINEIPATTPDFKTNLARQLQDLIPEAIADGKVDTKKLQELLEDDATDTSERFGLFWPGKKQAMQAAQEPTTATLKPAPDESKDWSSTENLFIEGDNLEVLKILQKHYHNKIKMIYIDPPYNTGNDFVYPDNYKEGLQSYLEFTGQLDDQGKKLRTNSDAEGRYHSNWLNMMYPRLKLAKNLLTQDGVIFISIDDHEYDNLKKILNEIYGERNFVNNFMWLHGKGKKTKNSRTLQQYILCYARGKESLPEWAEKQMATGSFSNPDNDPRGEWFSGSISFSEERSNPKHKNYFTVESPSGIKWLRQWQCTKNEMDDYISDNKIYFGGAPDYSNVPRLKIFPNDSSDIIPSNLLDSFDTTRGAQSNLDEMLGGNFFDNPKPVNLIAHLMKIMNINKAEDTVLDFFSGSGTAAHSVFEFNADSSGAVKSIQVQLPEPTEKGSNAYEFGFRTIADIAKERIRRAGEKIKADYADKLKDREIPLDTGFKVYKLSDTSFTKWKNEYTEDTEELQSRLLDVSENTSEDATEEDLLTEILLKLGFSLTAKVEQKDIEGLSVWSVSDGELISYLGDDSPSLDHIRAFAEQEPTKLVILDKSFNGNDGLKTNAEQICKSNNIELRTV